jgi:transposase InsO family protein
VEGSPPNDFTYVSSWRGFVYVAFIIDAFARKIVGWRVSTTANAQFVLNALAQAVHDRAPFEHGRLTHHSDRGSQYLSIKYSDRLADENIEPSVGSVGDSFDNALAETVIGLFKTEVIRHLGPWRNVDEVEAATLEWVDWFNNRRLLPPEAGTRGNERLGYTTPAEAEARFRAAIAEPSMAA